MFLNITTNKTELLHSVLCGEGAKMIFFMKFP